MTRALTLARRDAQRRGRRLRLFIFVLIFGGIFGLYYVIHSLSWFSIMEIKVIGCEVLSYEDIRNLAQIEMGGSFFALDTNEIVDRLESHDRIASASVKRKLPQTMEIVVVERKPVAILVKDQLLGIDAEGVIFPLRENDEYNLPLIRESKDETLNDSRITILNCLAQSDTFVHLISEVNIVDENEVVVYIMPNGIKTRIRIDEFYEKMYYLNEVIQDTEYRNLAVAEIDLRYDDAAVIKLKSK